MVSPVNGDKPLAPSTERSGQSSKSVKSEPAIGLPSQNTTGASAEPVSAIVEVDKARQLYEMESQKSSALDSAISTPDEARSLLNRILDQFGNAPEQALRSQGGNASAALANLLQTAPA